MYTGYVVFTCPICEGQFELSLASVEDMVKRAKIGKVGEVSKQLQEKLGPYYDRWLAAMEERGTPKRCKDCVYSEYDSQGLYCMDSSCEKEYVSPSWFACKWFEPKEGAE